MTIVSRASYGVDLASFKRNILGLWVRVKLELVGLRSLVTMSSSRNSEARKKQER
jgi:hypothetical protein